MKKLKKIKIAVDMSTYRHIVKLSKLSGCKKREVILMMLLTHPIRRSFT